MRKSKKRRTNILTIVAVEQYRDAMYMIQWFKAKPHIFQYIIFMDGKPYQNFFVHETEKKLESEDVIKFATVLKSMAYATIEMLMQKKYGDRYVSGVDKNDAEKGQVIVDALEKAQTMTKTKVIPQDPSKMN